MWQLRKLFCCCSRRARAKQTQKILCSATEWKSWRPSTVCRIWQDAELNANNLHLWWSAEAKNKYASSKCYQLHCIYFLNKISNLSLYSNRMPCFTMPIALSFVLNNEIIIKMLKLFGDFCWQFTEIGSNLIVSTAQLCLCLTAMAVAMVAKFSFLFRFQLKISSDRTRFFTTHFTRLNYTASSQRCFYFRFYSSFENIFKCAPTAFQVVKMLYV